MDIKSRNRSDLKSYFVKNAIPTESNFADLIDGMLNQKDDGIVKLPGDPLSIRADSDSALQKVVSFYGGKDESPAWTLQLSARVDPAKPDSAQPGLCVSDGAGNARLFIDAAKGALGVGTVTPIADLDIAQEARTGSHPGAVSGLYVTGGFGADNNGVELRHSNGTQGIGFGFNTIYAAGTNSDQDLNLRPKGRGNVGIGTTSPSAKLTVDPQGPGGIAIGNSSTSSGGFTSLQIEISAQSAGYAWLQSIKSSGTAWGDIVLNPSGGNIGIGTGTTAPNGRLDIANLVRIGLDEGGSGARSISFLRDAGDDVNAGKIVYRAGFSYDALNLVGAGSGTTRKVKVWDILDVAGRLQGGETATGWILGKGGVPSPDNWLRLYRPTDGNFHDLAVGSLWAGNQQRFDLAEVTPVNLGDQLEQGDVVVIDPEQGRRVTRCTRPMDTAVYGVVSSYDQAAMVIGGIGGPETAAETRDHLPIALVGRVLVKVSSESGPIAVGDLLTTAEVPGHAMRCGDRSRCAGAILGKALESLPQGVGLILALVTLQ